MLQKKKKKKKLYIQPVITAHCMYARVYHFHTILSRLSGLHSPQHQISFTSFEYFIDFINSNVMHFVGVMLPSQESIVHTAHI